MKHANWFCQLTGLPGTVEYPEGEDCMSTMYRIMDDHEQSCPCGDGNNVRSLNPHHADYKTLCADLGVNP